MARRTQHLVVSCTVLLLFCQTAGVQAARDMRSVKSSTTSHCMLAFYGGPIYCYRPSYLRKAEARAPSQIVSPVHVVHRLTGLRLSQVIDIYTAGGPIMATDYIFGGRWHVSGAQQPGTSGRYLDVEEIFQHEVSTAADRYPINVPGQQLSLAITSSLPRAVVNEVAASLLSTAGIRNVVSQSVRVEDAHILCSRQSMTVWLTWRGQFLFQRPATPPVVTGVVFDQVKIPHGSQYQGRWTQLGGLQVRMPFALYQKLTKLGVDHPPVTWSGWLHCAGMRTYLRAVSMKLLLPPA
jgi:hypothetical protein